MDSNWQQDTCSLPTVQPLLGIPVWQSNCSLQSAGSESPDGGDGCESHSTCFSAQSLFFSFCAREKGDVHTRPNRGFLAETQGLDADVPVATSPPPVGVCGRRDHDLTSRAGGFDRCRAARSTLRFPCGHYARKEIHKLGFRMAFRVVFD